MSLGSVTPVLRSFDAAKAREFYVEFFGFNVEFEHRFGDDFPLYVGLSRAGCVLHLSEHHGDACPGAHVRVATTDIEGFAAELEGKNYRYAKPGAPETMPWRSKELTVADPFGNRLKFFFRQEHENGTGDARRDRTTPDRCCPRDGSGMLRAHCRWKCAARVGGHGGGFLQG